MDDVEVGRRVAAARKRAGMGKRKTLTDAADLPKVGPATLGKIERGERHLFPHEAEAFARVLGVTPAFFVEEDTETQLDRIEQALADVAQREETASEVREGIRDLLAQQTKILSELTRVVSGMPDDEALRLWNEAARLLSEARPPEEDAQAGEG